MKSENEDSGNNPSSFTELSAHRAVGELSRHPESPRPTDVPESRVRSPESKLSRHPHLRAQRGAAAWQKLKIPAHTEIELVRGRGVGRTAFAGV
jgi:hypothetical protein